MLSCNNLLDNENVTVLEEGGAFSIIEWKCDLSVSPGEAQVKYFMSKMNLHRRQLVCDMNDEAITLQSGAMQWYGGGLEQTSGIKGAGDLAKKLLTSKVTKESAVQPEYVGTGFLVTEPTYKHLMVEDLSNWRGGLVIQDGMFLAADGRTEMSVVARENISSAVAGGEGFFNLCLQGKGFVVLESSVPRDELIEIVLQDDEVKIDGPLAIAWDASLKFTVERSGKSLIGSAASGEGLVNVYRGTGRILMAPGV